MRTHLMVMIHLMWSYLILGFESVATDLLVDHLKVAQLALKKLPAKDSLNVVAT